MNSCREGVRVAIFGATGIGRVHARLVHDLGATLCAVVGSSPESSARTARSLHDDFGIEVPAFHDPDEMFAATHPGAVIIATPPRVHADQILWAFNRQLPVLCEKPYFWRDDESPASVEEGLHALQGHPSRRLMVNTNNTHFLAAILARHPESRAARRFDFRFYSNGNARREQIAIDMLPHGLSLLIHLWGERPMTTPSALIEEHRYRCGFKWGECAVNFDFAEDPDGPRVLEIGLDGTTFRRIQSGRDRTYQVFLEKVGGGERFEVEDPFRHSIGTFLEWCSHGAPPERDGAPAAAVNLRAMARLVAGS